MFTSHYQTQTVLWVGHPWRDAGWRRTLRHVQFFANPISSWQTSENPLCWETKSLEWIPRWDGSWETWVMHETRKVSSGVLKKSIQQRRITLQSIKHRHQLPCMVTLKCQVQTSYQLQLLCETVKSYIFSSVVTLKTKETIEKKRSSFLFWKNFQSKLKINNLFDFFLSPSCWLEIALLLALVMPGSFSILSRCLDCASRHLKKMGEEKLAGVWGVLCLMSARRSR